MTDEEIKKIQDEVAAEKAAKEALAAELAEKDEKLKALEGKDMNFSKVREAAEKAEKEKAEIAKQLEDEKQARITEKKDSVIKAIAGGDEELKKVIEFHYSKFSGDAKTPEEIEARAKESFVLATKGQNTTIKNQQGAGGSGKPINSGVNTNNIDPVVKEWAGEFNKYGAGITDEALAKKNKK